MKIFYILCFFAFMFPGILINAQVAEDGSAKPKSKGYAIRMYYQGGNVLQTNNFVKGVNYNNTPVDSYQAMSLQFGWQTYGTKAWQQVYGYPFAGIGLYVVNFHRPEDLGTPGGVYGFLNGPFKRWKKLSLNYQTAIGMIFGWIPYNVDTNPYQIAIGATNTVKLDVGVSLNYLVSKYFELDLGITFTHFSNGSMTMPNYGINIYGPRVGLKYYIQGQPDFNNSPIPKYESQLEWLLELKMALKQITPDTTDINYTNPYDGADYTIFGVSSTINKQFTYSSKVGFGFDLIYDGSLNAQLDAENGEGQSSNANFYQSLAFSVFPSYELVIHKVSLLVQPGFYIYKKQVGDKPNIFYQRIGIKYHFMKNLYAGVNIKAFNFKVADYVEWVAGYRIFWNKK